MGELLDIYDGDKNLTGRVTNRGEPREEGEYVIVVHVLVQNSEGNFLITKRAFKKYLPDFWENTGGAAMAGETSLEAAMREFNEETGFTLSRDNGELLFTDKIENGNWSCFMDNWFFRQDFDIEDFMPQPGETVEAKWATCAEILAMHERGEFVPFSETHLDGYYKRLGLM